MTDLESLRREYADDPLLSEVLEELERLRAERAWQPIETAPMDGTRIQVAVIDRAGNILSDTGSYVEGEVHEEWDEVDDGVMVKLWEEQDDGIWSTIYELSELEYPTHWMPLPQPKEKDDG